MNKQLIKAQLVIFWIIAFFLLIVFSPATIAQSLERESAMLTLSRKLTLEEIGKLQDKGIVWDGLINEGKAFISVPTGGIEAAKSAVAELNIAAEVSPLPADVKLLSIYGDGRTISDLNKGERGQVTVIAQPATGNSREATLGALQNSGFEASLDPKVSGIIVVLPEEKLQGLAEEPFIQNVQLAPGFPMLN
jgi:hypothetical protein